MDPIECEIGLTENEDGNSPANPQALSKTDDELAQRTSNVDMPDIPRSPPNLNRDLRKILSKIQTSGSFGFSCENSIPYNPGLHIPSVGMIRVPISAEDSRAMIQASRMGIDGKGNETSNKIWQLDATQFSLQNPTWEGSIEKIRGEIYAHLGLTANLEEVKLELLKLLVYEEGASSLPHQDLEKTDGMFGKDVCLTFETGSSSVYDIPWAVWAWYADATHEVKPILSGYKVVLIYHLIHRPTAEFLKSQADIFERLSSLLGSWARAAERSFQCAERWASRDAEFGDNCPPALLYFLENEYSAKELSFEQLNDVDQGRVLELQQACRQTDCNIFLANIVKTDSGFVLEEEEEEEEEEEDRFDPEDPDHPVNGKYNRDYYRAYGVYPDYEPKKRPTPDPNEIHVLEDGFETKFELTHVVDQQGLVVGKFLSFSKAMIIQQDLLNRDPDNEDYGISTYDRLAEATHYYRETAVLIVPKKLRFLLEFEKLYKGQGDAKFIMDDCQRLLMEQPDHKLAKKRLSQVCRVFKCCDKRKGQELPGLICMKALELADFTLFSQAILLVDSFSSAQLTCIAKSIADHGIDALRSPFAAKFAVRQYVDKKSFLPKLELLSKLMAEYHTVCEQQSTEPSSNVIEWQRFTFGTLLITDLERSQSDGEKLGKAIYDHPLKGTLPEIEQFMQNHSKDIAFFVSFLISANQCSLAGQSEEDAVGEMVKRLSLKIIQPFQQAHESQPRLAPDLVVKLIKLTDPTSSDAKSLMNTLTRYTERLEKVADTSATDSTVEDAYPKYMFPVATELCEHITLTSRPATAEERNFLLGLLKSYIIGYVRDSKPPLPGKENWIVTYVPCTCSDCALLQRFIDDTGRKVEEFAMPEKRRDHLERRLDRKEFTTSTIKKGTPYRPRVEKTYAQLSSYHAAWLRRVGTAKTKMDALAQKCPPLKEILGEANYRFFYEHANLRVVPLSTGPPQPSSAPEANTQTTMPPRSRASSNKPTPGSNARTTAQSNTIPQRNASLSQYMYTKTQTPTPQSTVPQKRKQRRSLPLA
ncbi:hypothetical protein PMAA_055480 [Talaromyces marneffei ATCC 18224]|uniref:Prolyl 4-hydroxylase alpha subunit Fe(2+) 2OG dioxygenase domain-containing protein n=1 Tax=Talaromyces marneffei (strain ATCC 18224 / CBS 334.59 / QM 7333) TaxID=441960 RepID=B6QKX5_TALMQ|nr:hypothetical protein PMAA_055480 [Talaromyces marneffei ATCC 18224]